VADGTAEMRCTSIVSSSPNGKPRAARPVGRIRSGRLAATIKALVAGDLE
jgi:hypothetical protein